MSARKRSWNPSGAQGAWNIFIFLPGLSLTVYQMLCLKPWKCTLWGMWISSLLFVRYKNTWFALYIPEIGCPSQWGVLIPTKIWSEQKRRSDLTFAMLWIKEIEKYASLNCTSVTSLNSWVTYQEFYFKSCTEIKLALRIHYITQFCNECHMNEPHEIFESITSF